MKHIIILISIISISYCHAQQRIYGGENAGKYKKEEITLTKVTKKSGSQGAGIIAAIAPSVIKGGLGIYKNSLKAKEAKFSAEYSTKYSDEEFYSADREINLPELKLLSKHNDNTSLEAVFTPEYALNNQVFKFRLKELTLTNSKAKAKSDDKIDFQFSFALKALIQKDGKSSFETVTTNTLDVKGVAFATKLTGNAVIGKETDWFTIPAVVVPIDPGTAPSTKDLDAAGIQKIAFGMGLSVDELIKLEWFAGNDDGGNRVTRRYLKISDTSFKEITAKFKAGGLYKIELTIKEANPRKVKSQSLAKFFEDNSESITGISDAAIGFFFKDEESEEE